MFDLINNTSPTTWLNSIHILASNTHTLYATSWLKLKKKNGKKCQKLTFDWNFFVQKMDFWFDSLVLLPKLSKLFFKYTIRYTYACYSHAWLTLRSLIQIIQWPIHTCSRNSKVGNSNWSIQFYLIVSCL